MKNKRKEIFTKNHTIILLALLSCLLWGGSAFPSIKIGYELFFYRCG